MTDEKSRTGTGEGKRYLRLAGASEGSCADFF